MAGKGPEKLLWERKRRRSAVRLAREVMGPLKRLRFRLRMRSWVREVRGRMEPVRFRSWRTRRETRLRRQETPYQVQGSEVVEFQWASLLEGSEAALKDIRGWKSGLTE